MKLVKSFRKLVAIVLVSFVCVALFSGMLSSIVYADPTATIAVGRVAKEEREQIECEAADKRAYDLIKVLKYIIKGAGFELTERVQVKDTKTGRVYR